MTPLAAIRRLFAADVAESRDLAAHYAQRAAANLAGWRACEAERDELAADLAEMTVSADDALSLNVHLAHQLELTEVALDTAQRQACQWRHRAERAEANRPGGVS